jgi:hypothetical protein
MLIGADWYASVITGEIIDLERFDGDGDSMNGLWLEPYLK